MRVIKQSVILDLEERKWGGQYRIYVREIEDYPKQYRPGDLFKIEMFRIRFMDQDKILAVFTPVEGEFGRDIHRVSFKGQLTFTPPRALLDEDDEYASFSHSRYKTYKETELPF